MIIRLLLREAAQHSGFRPRALASGPVSSDQWIESGATMIAMSL
jgi:hypothetical protein